ncbi:MAG: hypothetical protein IJ563_06185 [Selenomonadaceae bacterium]|nr:hypothetical protein [Selenomonadaceae bacterium]MBR1858063.1 hypothetical protein [Selenomonadaceae bacterium]
MLKRLFVTMLAAVFMLVFNQQSVNADALNDRWSLFEYVDESDKSATYAVNDSFEITDDGFKCATDTVKWIVIDGREEETRKLVEWTFKIDNGGLAYLNSPDDLDSIFETKLVNAIIDYVAHSVLVD